MKRWILALLVMLAASPGWAAPRVTQQSTNMSQVTKVVTFTAGDTTDSEAIPVSGFCSVRYQQASGDDASLYAVTTATTAASSGTLIAAFTASTTTATTFTAGTRWVKAVATDATAGGSVMQIDCAPLTGGGGVLGSGPLADMLASSPRAGSLWQQTDDDGTGDCASTGGTDSALMCQWNEATSAWVAAGSGAGADNLGNHTATTNVDLDTHDLIGVGKITAEGATRTLSYAATSASVGETDPDPDCYFQDADGDGSYEVEGGDRCFTNRLVWMHEFADGSATLGLQDAIDSVCESVDANSKAVRGGTINIASGYYDLSTNYITVPANCFVIIRGQGVDSRFGATSSHAGTTLRFDLGTGGDAFTFTGPNQHWVVEDMLIQFSNQGAGSSVFSIPANNDHFKIENVYTIAQSAASVDGTIIDITDSQSFTVVRNRLEGMGTAISVAGAEGNGGGRIYDNKLRAGSGTGAGTNISISGTEPCVEINVVGNIIETANIGIDFTSTADHCHMYLSQNYFEPSEGSGEIDVRAAGRTSVTAVGNFFNPSTAVAFHRTAQSSSDAVDVFLGNEHRGGITMDAGRCIVHSVAKGSGSVDACGSAYLAGLTAFPANPVTGLVALVTDDSASGECDSAAGSATTLCRWTGSAWAAIGGDGGGGAGDLTAVGDCTTGDCFTVSGSGAALYALGSLALHLDDDGGSTGLLDVYNDTDNSVFRVSEAGVVSQLNTLTLSGTGTLNGLDALDATSDTTISTALGLTDAGTHLVTTDPLILDGDGDDTFEVGEVQISGGVVTADSLVSRPSTAPSSQYVDSDATDLDAVVTAVVNCSDAVSGQEDCDYTLSQYENGTPRQFLNADADDELELGGADQNRVVITTDSTGDAELVVPAGSISGSEIGTLSASNAPDAFLDPDKLIGDSVDDDLIDEGLIPDSASVSSWNLTTPTVTTHINLGSAGVRVADNGDGAITLTGQGDGTDEAVSINLDASNTLGITTSTGINNVSMGGISIDSTIGYHRGSKPVASSTGGTVTYNAMIVATAAGDYDIPDQCDSASGAWVTVFVRDAAETVSITTLDTGDSFVLKGIATLVANDEIDSPGAAGDYITLTCLEANKWYATEISGAWVDGGTAD